MLIYVKLTTSWLELIYNAISHKFIVAIIANTFLPFDTHEFLFLDMDAIVVKWGLNEQFKDQYHRRQFL